MVQLKRILSFIINEFPFLGYYSFIVGILFGKAFISLGFAFVIVSFLIRYFRRSLKLEFHFPAAFRMFLIFIGFYLLSFCWTSNLLEFKHELISRIIFFVFPIVFFLDNQLIKKRLMSFLHLFVVATLLCSILNFFIFQSYFEIGTDIRKLSHFGSHIRFGICCVLSIVLIIKSFSSKQRKFVQFFWIACLLWLLYYTYFSQVMSAVAMLLVAALIHLLRVISTNWHGKLKWIFFAGLFSLIAATIIFLVQFLFENNQDHFPKKLATYTKLGNIYLHDTTVKVFENGNALFINYCPKEMDSVWNLKSTLDVDFENSNHYSVRSVLMRYLTSKGLTKDAEGVNQLTRKDIRAIERGIPSVTLINSNGFVDRLNEIKFELSDRNDPNGHSLLQRFEFWKASMSVIQSNLWIGVGAGDMSDAMQQTYVVMKTKLKKENRLGSHNQFLDIAARLGIVGLFIFIVMLLLFVKEQMHCKNVFGLFFICIMMTSFLVEDTLNTLTGMSIFSLFFAFNSTLNFLEPVKK